MYGASSNLALHLPRRSCGQPPPAYSWKEFCFRTRFSTDFDFENFHSGKSPLFCVYLLFPNLNWIIEKLIPTFLLFSFRKCRQMCEIILHFWVHDRFYICNPFIIRPTKRVILLPANMLPSLENFYKYFLGYWTLTTASILSIFYSVNYRANSILACNTPSSNLTWILFTWWEFCLRLIIQILKCKTTLLWISSSRTLNKQWIHNL